MDSRLSRSTHLRSAGSRSPRIAARVGVLLVVLVVGIWLGGHPSWLPASIRSTLTDDSSGQLVNETLNMLTRDYYRPLNRAQLLNKGLASMVASLHDPYSHYYDPGAYRSFLSQSNPHLSGIGIDVLPDPRGLRVIDVFPHSPAARSGLQHNDVITKVGSTSLVGRSTNFASALIRGPAGTKVMLTVVRTHRTRPVSVVRANLVVPVASGTVVT